MGESLRRAGLAVLGSRGPGLGGHAQGCPGAAGTALLSQGPATSHGHTQLWAALPASARPAGTDERSGRWAYHHQGQAKVGSRCSSRDRTGHPPSTAPGTGPLRPGAKDPRRSPRQEGASGTGVAQPRPAVSVPLDTQRCPEDPRPSAPIPRHWGQGRACCQGPAD